MIDHYSRFQENDNLPLWQGPDVKEKLPFPNARNNHAQNYAQ